MSSRDAKRGVVCAAAAQRRTPSAASWPHWVGALVVTGAAYLFARTIADPDLWGHLRFGGDLWATRQLIRSDPYSYLTTAVQWVNHEWLAELAFYLVFAAAGPVGLVALKAAVGALVAGLGYGHLLRRGAPPTLAGALTVLAMAALRSELATVRPQLFTHLLAMLLILLMFQAESGRLRWVWAAPALFAVWANSHGGYLAGAGLVLVWAAAHAGGWLATWVRRRQRPSARALAAPGLLLAGLAGTLANPYGSRLWAFLLRTATVPRPEISEWQPLPIMSADGLCYLALLGLSLAGLLGSRRRRSPALIAVLACAALLPLSARRHTGLFGVVALISAGEHICDAAQRWLRLRPAGSWAPRPLALAPVLVTPLAFLALAAHTVAGGIPIAAHEGCPLPVRAVALLRDSGVGGNLAVHFDWGEYVIWHLGPRVRVSVDGRRETVYPERVYHDNLRFMSGVGEWDTLLGEGTDMALVATEWPTFNLMRLEPGWALVYEDPLCGLFVRQASPLLARIRATPLPDVPYDGAGLSFP